MLFSARLLRAGLFAALLFGALLFAMVLAVAVGRGVCCILAVAVCSGCASKDSVKEVKARGSREKGLCAARG
jgi:C4-dicarboxylate transporter